MGTIRSARDVAAAWRRYLAWPGALTEQPATRHVAFGRMSEALSLPDPAPTPAHGPGDCINLHEPRDFRSHWLNSSMPFTPALFESWRALSGNELTPSHQMVLSGLKEPVPGWGEKPPVPSMGACNRGFREPKSTTLRVSVKAPTTGGANVSAHRSRRIQAARWAKPG